MDDLKEVLKFYQEIGADFLEKKETNPSIELNQLVTQIRECQRCQLYKTKKNYVPGEGALDPDALFIGEGPGETEDNFGKPFIGKAGQLLDKLINKMGYSRETVFIGNIVKCRPPNNRDPLKEEVKACMPFLIKQIEILSPKVIVCLGRIAMNNLLGANYSIMEVHGQQFDLNGIPVIPTFHPAYILHQKTKEKISKAKWDTWNDMQKVLTIIKNS